MPEQPLVDIPVSILGVSGAITEIGQFAQETVNELDNVEKAVQKLMETQEQQLLSLRSQIQAESSEIWQKRRDEIKATQEELNKLRQAQEGLGETTQRVLGIADFSFSKLLQKVPGTAILQGGILALFLHGYGETGRINAEARTLAQVFEASSNQAISSTRGLIEVFNDLENTTGITRDKMETVVSMFAQMGVPARELTRDINNVESNLVMASASFDAFLERGIGTTAKDFITMMSRFNMSSEEVIGTYGRMVNAARESEIGTERFMTTLFDASRTLKTYGVDVLQLTGLFSSLNRTLEEMGVPIEARLSGLAGIAQGLAGIPQQWRALIGMDILRNTSGQQGPITPMGGIMAFETGAMEGRTDFLVQTLTSMQERLLQQIAVVPEQQRAETLYAILRQGMNFNPEAAAMLRKLFLENTDFRAMAATPGKIDDLKKVFKDEGQKRTDWQEAVKAIMGAIQQLAMGIFEVLTTTLSVIVGGVTYFIGWAVGPLEGREMRAQTLEIMSGTLEAYKSSVQRFSNAAKLFGQAGGALASGMGLAAEYIDVYKDYFNKRDRTGLQMPLGGEVGTAPSAGLTGTFGPSPLEYAAAGTAAGWANTMFRSGENALAPAVRGGLGQSLGYGVIEKIRERLSIEGAMKTDGKTVAITFSLDDLVAAMEYNNDDSRRTA